MSLGAKLTMFLDSVVAETKFLELKIAILRMTDLKEILIAGYFLILFFPMMVATWRRGEEKEEK